MPVAKTRSLSRSSPTKATSNDGTGARRQKLMKEAIKRAKLASYTDPLTGFQTFCESEMKIITKNAKEGFKPFIFNDAQKLIVAAIEKQRAETGKVRAIILKARQQGISTLITGRVFWKAYFAAHTSAVVMAHDGPTSEVLFKMSKNVIENLSPEFKPNLEKSAAREIIFEHNNSSYRLFTAGAPESGRGVTPSVAHLSEVAFWPYDEKILAGLFQGVSGGDDTEIILESTANGIGNEFHRIWEEASKPNSDSDYIAIFIPWFLTQEYRRALPPGFQKTPEEKEVAKKFKLDDQQIYWRRLKIIESGSNTFMQEYPATPEEAFITSGSSVFDKEILAKYIPQPTIRVMEYDHSMLSFSEASITAGSLRIFKKHDHATPFAIGADVAMGVGKDYSAAIVMDAKKQIYALYRNNLLDPSLFGDVLFYLSRMYNNAMLGVETNSMGVATINRLEQMEHQNLYRPLKNANTTSAEKPGFRTTHTSKPAIIGNLKRAVEGEELWIPSNIIISEMTTYITKDNGATEAAAGKFDDTVMATAITLEMLRTHGDKLSVGRIPFKQRFSAFEDTPADNTNWF